MNRFTALWALHPAEAEAEAADALTRCNGNVAQAARWLGVSRRTLFRKIQERPRLKALVKEVRQS